MIYKCRFCPGYAGLERMVKYGTRHYAHFECYLDARKSMAKLTGTQIGRFPFKVLKDRDLLDEAEDLIRYTEADQSPMGLLMAAALKHPEDAP